MKTVKMPSRYYQQFDADVKASVPAENYGGWKKETLDFNPERSALVIMHAWDCGTADQYPGWFRAVEYLPRANRILKEVFPPLLAAVRESGMTVYHVVSRDKYYRDRPGYISTMALGLPEAKHERAERDDVWNSLNRFRSESIFPGVHNQPDIGAGFRNLDFPAEATPADSESIAENAEQLFALCKRDGINHLVYAGFAVNWCLLMSDGCMLDMFRRGLICSTIRQAVTAVENKESAAGETHKEEALWRVSLMFGMVYDDTDFIAVLKGASDDGTGFA
jgi:nicotinamidase-related amidase